MILGWILIVNLDRGPAVLEHFLIPVLNWRSAVFRWDVSGSVRLVRFEG